jgi:ribosomal protein L29
LLQEILGDLMKKVEIKGQNDEQLKQLILKNQKDIVAEKIAIFTQQTTKNHVIKTKKKEIAIAKTILNFNRKKNTND